MTPNDLPTEPNPDLAVGPNHLSAWNQPERRRRAFHGMHRMFRYVIGMKAPRVLRLDRRIDWRIGALPSVRRITGATFFSGLCVVRGHELLYEQYAPDFGPNGLHSIQSITKTTMNLVYGRLVEEGQVDLGRRVRDYLPEAGSGYAGATIQDVLDMNVVNDFTEVYTDPLSDSYVQEVAEGWRLPAAGEKEPLNRDFVAAITGSGEPNTGGLVQYKSPNTDILGWIAERVTGRTLREMLLEIVEAAGLEGTLFIGTDRAGVPVINGGICASARDLARYALLFTRGGVGVNGERVGSAAFIAETLRHKGPSYAPPRQWQRYSNHTATDGEVLGHGGFGGQYMVANPRTGVAAAFFSVIESGDATDPNYAAEYVAMLEEITRMA
jgi:CubicO group peptidase (beta-lactamase class C family)